MKSMLNKLPARAGARSGRRPAAWAAALRRPRTRPSRCAGPPGTRPTRWSSCRKDFTAKTGIKMKFEFVPWPNFADRMLNELNSKGKLCDLIIGDSQWIGGAAENGHYVKLNDFFAKEGIKMSDFAPATVLRLFRMAEGHAELLGAAGDGRRARLDLPQGLVRQARAAGRVQGEVQPRPRRRRRPGPSSSRWPSSSRAARSTARRSTAPTSSPSAAPKASPWA